MCSNVYVREVGALIGVIQTFGVVSAPDPTDADVDELHHCFGCVMVI